MADPSLPDQPIPSVSTHTDRLIWLIGLIQDDTLVLFAMAQDRPSELAFLEFGQILDDAGNAIKRRYEQFLQGGTR